MRRTSIDGFLSELVERRRPFDLREQDGLQVKVFERDHVLLLVQYYFRRERHAALALAGAIQLHLDNRERIVDRTRLVRRFEEADRAIGRQHDAFAAVLGRVMTREADIPTKLARSPEVALDR